MVHDFLVISSEKNVFLVFSCCVLVSFCAVGLECQGAGCKGQFVSWVLLEFGKAVRLVVMEVSEAVSCMPTRIN